ncbi:MAG: DNA primase small subunit domain-containing protein [archaeon]
MENEGESGEKRKVQIVAQSYYARKEIQEAIYKFCKNRETVPRYLEGFGKRPDVLDYPSDVMTLVKKGATSFHCSEEIWSDPLKISTDMTPDKYNQIKIGWDFLIDIDSKFFDYAKIAAKVLIQAMESHGIKNIGIKYSGSKGFHILIPSKSFPEELYGEKTKDNFPEWPRAVAGYLKEITKDKVNQQIINLTGKEKLKQKGELIEKIYCTECKNEIVQKEEDLFECPNSKCKYKLYFKKSKRKDHRCPNCKFNMNFLETYKRYFCEKCGKYKPNPKIQTTSEQTTKAQEDSVDIVLVSPRHLFRAPYSLHEKTALVSAVITKEELDTFEINMADPLKIKIRDYNPSCEAGEARELLIESLDWAKKKEPERKKYDGKALDLKGLIITEDMFPPVIKKIMVGMKEDGRKRALGVLLSFFSSLEFPKEYMEEKVYEWNKKNYKPLREGYVQSQIEWAAKNKRLPPNYDKTTYKELNVASDTEGLKNPINYTIREAMRQSFRTGGNKDDSEKETNSSSDKQNTPKK